MRSADRSCQVLVQELTEFGARVLWATLLQGMVSIHLSIAMRKIMTRAAKVGLVMSARSQYLSLGKGEFIFLAMVS